MNCNYLTREIKVIVFNRDIIFIFLLYKYSIPSKNILYILSRSIRTNSFFYSFQFQEFLFFFNFYSLICLYCSTCANLRKSNYSFEINLDSINSARIIINETGLTVCIRMHISSSKKSNYRFKKMKGPNRWL